MTLWNPRYDLIINLCWASCDRRADSFYDDLLVLTNHSELIQYLVLTDADLLIWISNKKAIFHTGEESGLSWFIFLFLIRAVKQMKRADFINTPIKASLSF